MKYVVIESHSVSDLNQKVNTRILEGWKPKGSHKVLKQHEQHTYSGNQPRQVQVSNLYSQTMLKN